MKFYGDFHIHSHYSIATSKELVPEYLEYWGRLKGISVIGTGDIIHPGWFSEIEEKTRPKGNGLFTLQDQYRLDLSKELFHPNIPSEINFILTGEISSIYKEDGKVRKVHNVAVFPSLESAKKVQQKLDTMGNIRSDGRPILGIDSKTIVELVLESGEGAFVIPAHIWTPWFSVLGSKSGFDTIEECYGHLSSEIFALETGLSSDPAMNRCCSFLDNYRLVSNSDAHSPEKLGREANIFDTEMDYSSIYRALKTGENFLGTVEFFPHEGKYHFDGHRKCGIKWDPLETLEHEGICPRCGKPITQGVMSRVAELADRTPGVHPVEDFYSITQLPDLLKVVLGVKNSKSKKVRELFFTMVRELGSEFVILMDTPLDEIAQVAGEETAEGIRRLRQGEVILHEGFDGEFGSVEVFQPGEIFQGGLFAVKSDIPPYKGSMDFDLAGFQEKFHLFHRREEHINEGGTTYFTDKQQEAIEHSHGHGLVIAGPGSGKTRVLVEHLKYILHKPDVRPCAITFTNRAAGELQERLGKVANGEVFTGTIHSLGLKLLKYYYQSMGETMPSIVLLREREEIAVSLLGTLPKGRTFLREVDLYKETGEEKPPLFEAYSERLQELHLIDMGDAIYLPVHFANDNEEFRRYIAGLFTHVLVDEFQDLSHTQYRLLTLLTGGELFAIGDPHQSIYSFRGALYGEDIFSRYFSPVTTYTLDRSFRVPDPLLRASLNILNGKEELSGKDVPVKAVIHPYDTGRSEADGIAALIEDKLGGVRSFSMESGMTTGDGDYGPGDIAILCRSSFIFDDMEEALMNHGIPYRVFGREGFWQQEPYVSAAAIIMRYVYNRHVHSELTSVPQDIVTKIDAREDLSSVLRELLAVNGYGMEEQKEIEAKTTGYGSTYEDFLEDMVSMRENESNVETQRVSLMTIHAAKGLEFPMVSVAGCDNTIIPFTLFGEKDERHLEEEKRLLYVAMTRASQELHLSYAHRRTYKKRTIETGKSEFLKMIDETLVNIFHRERKKTKADENQLELFS